MTRQTPHTPQFDASVDIEDIPDRVRAHAITEAVKLQQTMFIYRSWDFWWVTQPDDPLLKLSRAKGLVGIAYPVGAACPTPAV